MFSLNSNYYGTPYTMARHLKTTQTVMEDFQRRYFRNYPGIPQWHRDTAIELQETGQITTPLGRRRQFWGRLRDDTTLREAIAFVPQSLVADITNMGLYKIWYHMEPEVQILAQVHDAVILQIPSDRVDELLPRVLELILTPVEVHGRLMTIEAEAEVGLNWAKFNDDPKKGPLNLNGIKKWKKGN